MLKVESMEDERLVFSIITPNIPYRIKEKLYDAIEQFEQNRSI